MHRSAWLAAARWSRVGSVVLGTVVPRAVPAQQAAPPPAAGWQSGDYFPAPSPTWPHERLTPLLNQVSTERLRRWHDLLASEPHVAGSPGDQRQVERIAGAFAELGLEVEKHEIWVYLARPVSAVLEVIGDGERPVDDTSPRKELVLKERIVEEDLDSANPDLSWGWNAYSGSGDVTAEVVYCNRGTKADFARLRELGVDIRGKIALCRYGGNFRGYKVKFAQEAGAVGLVIFTDPARPEELKTGVYPAGGAPNDTCIERGSIVTLDYSGDPLTPGIEATRDADRVDPAAINLPRIPVQPIGWGPAREILVRMAAADDAAAPSPVLPDGWQGGLNVPYRIVGGPGVKLRMKIEQERAITRTHNVIGTLKGTDAPDEWVLVGSHHDAWGFGACDPAAGTICTMEAAAVFAEAARAGDRPRRTLKFCTWGAEEFGIIGSTEWVESRRAALEQNGIAYINLDMSVMGPNFGSAASPSLKTIITEVARRVPAVGAQLAPGGAVIGPTVFDTWITREPDAALPGQPRFGDLGGGSDHVAFWCHAGVPSASMGSGGAPGSAYHSVYDTLKWYRQNVSDTYEPAQMVSRMVVGTLSRLASDESPPYDQARIFHDAARRLEALERLADSRFPPERSPSKEIAAAAASARAAAATVVQAVERLDVWRSHADEAYARHAARMAESLRRLPRRLMAETGLPSRPWYRNEQASPDADSGYQSWILPRLTLAIERDDAMAAKLAAEHYQAMFAGAAAEVSWDVQRVTEPSDGAGGSDPGKAP